MHNTLVHFEIPANDPEKLRGFYAKLFGWKIEKTQGPVEYWMVTTAPEGQGVNGGIMRKQNPQQRPMNYILVDSVESFAKKVSELGGKVIVTKEEVPGMGYFAVALDPEGNPFGLWQSL